MTKITSPEAFHLLFLLFSIFCLFAKSFAFSNCRTVKSQWGFALEHPHYHSLQTKAYPECLLHCLKEKTRCKSLTYDLMTKICKLNTETRRTKPSKYRGRPYSIYKENPEGIIQAPVSTTAPTTQPSLCGGKVDGDYPHPTNCIMYIACVNGSPYERHCNSLNIPGVCPGICPT